MKPCYHCGDELLVLADIVKDGEELWQSCTARISQGALPRNTMISKKVAARAGWWTKPDGEASQGPHLDPPVLLHCKLRVGRCELSTAVHVLDEEAFLEQRIPFDWHIHLGGSVVEALICAYWDADICYLGGATRKGTGGLPASCPPCCHTFAAALDSGHTDCARYWHGHLSAKLKGKPRQEGEVLLYNSASLPSAEVLMHAHDVLGLSWCKYTCVAAAAAGSVACLSFAHWSGCPWDASVCSSAAAVGSTACLVYAHEHGCEWDAETCAVAAEHGSMACLVYAHEHGCEWNTATCAAAARHGHLDCLVYARTHGCQWDERTCSGAAAKDNLEILKYAFEHGCPWDGSTCTAAASWGSIDCLAYAHEHGCPWISPVCGSVAKGARPQCLPNQHKQHCHWDCNALHAAARSGHLDCLMYAHKHGCPYDIVAPGQYCEHGLSFAAVAGVTNLLCLKYVHESMGCSWHVRGVEWRYALQQGRCDVLKYIHQHGGAWCGEEELQQEGVYYWDLCGPVEGTARCLLYMHCCGGCKLPPSQDTTVAMRVSALMRERRAAVLCSFRAACRARAGSRSAGATHAAMDRVPADIIKQIICAAKLLSL